MRRRSIAGCLITASLLLGLVPVHTAAASAAGGPTPPEGTLSSGARYSIHVPEDWNGTLLVWSSGYGPGGGTDRPVTVGQSAEATQWLLDGGYALAGMTPTTAGWAVEDYLNDQPEVVTKAAEVLGAKPSATVAWGTSMGGLTTAALVERNPEVFDGGFVMCGSVAGGVGMLNQSLDAAFVFKTLLAPDEDAIELVDVQDEAASTAAAKTVLDAAQATPEGRARIALAATMADIPGWTSAGDHRPDADDHRAQEQQQYGIFMPTVFSPRQDLEALAGGAFSWNTGVDYERIFAASEMRGQIESLYADAGLDLQADLDRLAREPRISAKHSAVQYMLDNATPTGAISRPVLTLHEMGDTFPAVTQAQAYAAAVAAEGRSDLLRQSFVDRPGHCAYSPAEILAGLTAVEERIESGMWPDTSAAALQERAASLIATSDIDLGSAGEFIDAEPSAFHRPFYPGGWGADFSGALPGDGGEYRGVTPANWDGSLAILPGDTQLDRPELDWLRARGTATLAYDLSQEWDLPSDRDNATAVHDLFVEEMGVQPGLSFVAGRSQGGLTTRNVVQQNPQWLSGAIAMCGGGAGAISMWNYKLDAAFALKMLVDPESPMKIVGIADPGAEQAAVEQLIGEALESDLGAARLVFASALARIAAVDTSGADLVSLDERVDAYARNLPFGIGGFVRAGFEAVVGGNFSWNNDVDYRAMLAATGRLDEVRAAYAAAGADLEADLQTLQTAERITADAAAVTKVEQMATFDGALRVPVVSMTTTGDAAGPIADEGAYRSVVEAAGAASLLDQRFVQADGHCTFSTAEYIAAYQLLFDRISGGDAPDDTASLNSRMPGEDTRFVDVTAPVGLRMWDARDWGTYDPTAVAAAPTLTLSTTSVRPGDTVTATIAGFTAGGEYAVGIDGAATAAAVFTADEHGAATVEISVDAAQRAGAHSVSAVSAGGTTIATVDLAVLAGDGPVGGADDASDGSARDGSLAVTGGPAALAWTAAAIALLLTGLGGVLTYRRKQLG